MFKMIEIEKCPCTDRQEAEKREAELIREFKASMNTLCIFNDIIRFHINYVCIYILTFWYYAVK
jgi:hypothetical protein